MCLGSEIRDPEKTYPGSRGQKGAGSGSATLVLNTVRDSIAVLADPGFGAILIPGSGIRDEKKNPDPGSGINISDPISER